MVCICAEMYIFFCLKYVFLLWFGLFCLLDHDLNPTLSGQAVFPTIDPSHENSARVSPTVSKMMAQALVICEDHVPHSDPPTPTPEVVTTVKSMSVEMPVKKFQLLFQILNLPVLVRNVKVM